MWDIDEEGAQGSSPTSVLNGHEGPVWQVSWAHPKFGNVLASCSYDRRVIIWKEEERNKWVLVYDFQEHESSVNSICWAPHEFGLTLACASSDGFVSVINYKEGSSSWEFSKFVAHQMGVNCVSWAPAQVPGFLVDTTSAAAPLVRRLATGGCDNLVKLWKFDDSIKQWVSDGELTHHKDWVRDVAFAPHAWLPGSTLASCSHDGTVVVWTKPSSGAGTVGANSGGWQIQPLPKFPEVVWRISWSLAGSILAVAVGDNKVTLWKETTEGTFECISALDKDAPAAAVGTASPVGTPFAAQ